jgi:hypothetical protein
MMAKPNPARPQAKAKKKRSATFLLIQIGVGGVVGVVFAVVILKFLGAFNFGFGRAQEGPVGVAESRDVSPGISKEIPNPPRAAGLNDVKKPITRNPDKPPEETSPLVSSPPKKEPETPDVGPATVIRLPMAKEALAEHFSKSKLPEARFWWCDEGVFELDNKGEFRFTTKAGVSSQFQPMGASNDFLELENERHDLRVRLFADHAESSTAPFEDFSPTYSAGKWLVAPDQTGVDWFFRAIVELESVCRKSRSASKEYMKTLFAAAEKLRAVGKLKDVPFGFDLPAEQERFERFGFVPWTAPLLPMTIEYLQECRKMHRNEETAYDRVASKLNGQRERAAKDFLEYHQWRHARAWPLAVLAWTDAANSKEVHHTLMSNGTVNDPSSKDTWKITGDVLDVDIGESRVRIKIGQTGKDFSLLGQEKPVTGNFLFEPMRVAY